MHFYFPTHEMETIPSQRTVVMSHEAVAIKPTTKTARAQSERHSHFPAFPTLACTDTLGSLGIASLVVGLTEDVRDPFLAGSSFTEYLFCPWKCYMNS